MLSTLEAFFSAHPRRRYWLAAGLLVLAAAAAGLAGYRSGWFAVQGAAATEAAAATAAIRRGDLVLTASGSGTLASSEQVDLAFAVDGEVKDVRVKMGDTVKAGDILAQVDDTAARIRYEQAERALAELTSPAAVAAAQQGVADAKSELDSARLYLEYLISPEVYYWQLEIEAAEQAIASAQAVLAASPAAAGAKKDLEKAQAYLDFARGQLVLAQKEYEKVYVEETFPLLSSDGEDVFAVPTQLELDAAYAAIDEAEENVEQSGYLLAVLTGGQVPEEADSAGLLALQRARQDLVDARQALEDTRIYASIPGTVTYVGVEIGDVIDRENTVESVSVSGGGMMDLPLEMMGVSAGTNKGAVISITDLSQPPCLEVSLDETDWEKAVAGNHADVVFDSLPGQTFSGTVTSVDQELDTSGTTAMVTAVVTLEVTFDELDLPLGSTAFVEVTGMQARDVPLVPLDALYTNGSGEYYVDVLEDGETRRQAVVIGLQDILYAEVRLGLGPGDVVVLKQGGE